MRSKLEKHTNLRDISLKTSINEKTIHKYYKKLLMNTNKIKQLYSLMRIKSQTIYRKNS
jgi:hypothetical protein